MADDLLRKQLELYLSYARVLKENILRVLSNSTAGLNEKYTTYGSYVGLYCSLAENVEIALHLPKASFATYDRSIIGNPMNTPALLQKTYVEDVALKTDLLITFLENKLDIEKNEFESLAEFINGKLRASMFSEPEKEVEVQDNLERLFVGKGLSKGIDYDRESGKLEFSGKEYIPDFIVYKLNLCIEVKLLKAGRRSRIIDEINADITAYRTRYEKQLFVVYDLGEIRDENEFRRDIENAGASIKVVIVKH